MPAGGDVGPRLPRGTDGWSMSDERSFFENLLVQRFNFLLVFAGLVVAGYVEASNDFVRLAVLLLGVSVCWPLRATLIRAQQKLTVIMRHLYSDPTHPAAIVDEEVGRSGSRQGLIGKSIPNLLSWSFTLALLVQLLVSLVRLRSQGAG